MSLPLAHSIHRLHVSPTHKTVNWRRGSRRLSLQIKEGVYIGVVLYLFPLKTAGSIYCLKQISQSRAQSCHEVYDFFLQAAGRRKFKNILAGNAWIPFLIRILRSRFRTKSSQTSLIAHKSFSHDITANANLSGNGNETETLDRSSYISSPMGVITLKLRVDI